MVQKPVGYATQIIGNTPVVKLGNVVDDGAADVYVKLEYRNSGGPVKDRITLATIEKAKREGKIRPGDTIIEPTSGSTGIDLASVCTAKGYKTVFTMPGMTSQERRNLSKAYGAELILTPGSEAMKGAIEKVEELKKKHGCFESQQFENPANPEIHGLTTGPELVEQFKDRQTDIFLADVGTGGTLPGVGRVLKKEYPNVEVVAVEPETSPVLSGDEPSPYKLRGLGAGLVPGTLNTEAHDSIIKVSNDIAMDMARHVAREEDILADVSSDAVIYATIQKAKELGEDKTAVTVLPSDGERYLSTPLHSFDN